MKRIRQLVHQRNFPILVILLSALTLGLLIFTDFGTSWDEPDFYRYADSTIKAYSITDHLTGAFKLETTLGPGDLRYYGPAFLIVGKAVHVLLALIFPDTLSCDLWHLVIYITFLLGVFLFYQLARRFVSTAAAIVSTLVFSSQPVIFGSAWINPKDIPFMVFFMGTIYLGLVFSDRMRSGFAGTEPESLNGVRIRRPQKAALIFSFMGACIFLGLACATRLAGVFAGLLVICIWSVGLKKKSIPWIAAYGLISVAIFYVSWPYIWQDTLASLLFVARRMSDFPDHRPVLFAGWIYDSRSLPASYLPTLLVKTLSEPAILLFFAGLAVSVHLFIRKEQPSHEILLLLAWFFIPFFYVIITTPPIYDNYRHFLFILPAAFLLCALAIDFLFRKLKNYWLNTLLMAAILLPGFTENIHLHPYEYAYFNKFSGGIKGAAHRYEVDYWLTCYKELTQQINANEKEPLVVYSFLSSDLVNIYANPNLTVVKAKEGDTFLADSLVILPLRWDRLELFPEYPVKYTVKLDDVDICVAKLLK